MLGTLKTVQPTFYRRLKLFSSGKSGVELHWHITSPPPPPTPLHTHTHTHTHPLSTPVDKGSNPEFELLETFETQLSTMKKDLANKDRMLSMYETSMADLSSKVHYLKKTLDEKVSSIYE